LKQAIELISTLCIVGDTSVGVNLFEYYDQSNCKQVFFIVIGINTFTDVTARSFPADLFFLLLNTMTLSRLSLLGSLLCCFSVVNGFSMGLGGSGK
jgi:hypothetical protein